ncbi:unnamed protein product [Clonostachys chloroleuca]|uniref:CCD97-like C-terminal domain-containing protein n=1 Tax=Clonostachys chloroleuca TaxID=1926264 RepID=A0AA35Q0I2_9HYPO|nr:unnamed protein product [Clonostachys chloroleuca]
MAPLERAATRSPASVARIRAQNRRREYLQQHPSYYDNIEHELADPVIYERLVKRFQSAEERSKDVKAKGYGRTLEASLVRGETTLANLRAEEQGNSASASDSAQGRTVNNGPASMPSGLDAWDDDARDKQEGLELWRAFLEDRFVHGRDDEFDYTLVDSDEGYDAMEIRDAEDRWFDKEEPSWVGDDDDVDETKASHNGASARETGIQDF